MSRRWKSRAAVRAAAVCRSSRHWSAAGCSRSSVSSHDIAPPRAEDGPNLEPIVEDDDVRERAGLEEADVAAREEPGGHLGRRAHGLLEGNAESVKVLHRLDHREHGAGKCPVLAHRRGAVFDRNLDVAELEGAAVA